MRPPPLYLLAPEGGLKVAPVFFKKRIAINLLLLGSHEYETAQQVGLGERTPLGIKRVKDLLRIVTLGQGYLDNAEVLLKSLQ